LNTAYLHALSAHWAALPAEDYALWLGLAGGGTLFAAWASLACLRKARLLEDTPTSRIRSAAQGYVELNGRAHLLPGPPILSPLSQARCAWWRYRVEEHQSSWHNGRRRRHWRTVESACSDNLFLLDDGTGECVVDPHGATVTPGLRRRWQGAGRRPARIPPRSPWLSFGRYRYTEELLFLYQPLYALGLFRTQSAIQAFDEDRDLRELLAEWKRDTRRLLREFDGNGDGQIDLQEWEAVRRNALQQVRQTQVEQSVQPDIHVLCRPADGRPYLLSARTEAQLTGRYRRLALGATLLAALLGALGLALLRARGLLQA
jgi:hypothetical protein